MRGTPKEHGTSIGWRSCSAFQSPTGGSLSSYPTKGSLDPFGRDAIRPSMLLDAEMNAQLENYKPQSIRLQADRSQWVSEEPLLPTMSQEDLKATDVHHPEGLTSGSLHLLGVSVSYLSAPIRCVVRTRNPPDGGRYRVKVCACDKAA